MPFDEGTHLGQWKNEITSAYGKNAEIVSFASSGPKSYSFLVNTGDSKLVEVLKFKGISLTKACKEKLHFDSLVGLIANSVEQKYFGKEGRRRYPELTANDDIKFEIPSPYLHEYPLSFDIPKPFRVQRKKTDCTITAQSGLKTVRFYFVKKYILGNYRTIPYGYF